MKIFKDIAHSVLDVLFPRSCSVCGKTLAAHEKHICTACTLNIPYTCFHEVNFNPMEQLFAGKILIERAVGCFYYEKDNPYSNILHDIKYHNIPTLGRYMARNYAQTLVGCGLFSDIDCIIPVPLHISKRIRRGYNQSEHIARGLADILNVPVMTDIIIAEKGHETQTNKGIHERWLNTQGIFSAQDKDCLKDKHVLIVDDVVTTGATLLSAALTIADVPGIKISLATLGVARLQ